MFQSKFTTPLAIAALGCLIGFGAAAHEFVASSKTTPANGKDTAAFILDSTHVFGTPEEAEAPKHVRAQLITPSATTELDVTENADAPNLTGTFTLSKEEPAWLVGHRLPVIWSQTPDGWKEGGPDTHPDAVASSRFEKFSKNLTGGSQNADFVSSPLGHKLEIVPLSDPRMTAIGQDVAVQILLDGQPYSTSVLATYAGFTDTPSSYAYYTETFSDDLGSGIAKIRITKPGLWMVRVVADVPDSDASVRVHNLRATLTFDVSQ